nr:C4 [Opuntia virus 2-DBG_56]
MGNLISMCLSNSKAKSKSQIIDSSTWFPQPGQHISIQTFRELNPAPMSSPTSTRMEIHWNGENSKSTEEVLGEAATRLMIHTPRH